MSSLLAAAAGSGRPAGPGRAASPVKRTGFHSGLAAEFKPPPVTNQLGSAARLPMQPAAADASGLQSRSRVPSVSPGPAPRACSPGHVSRVSIGSATQTNLGQANRVSPGRSSRVAGSSSCTLAPSPTFAPLATSAPLRPLESRRITSSSAVLPEVGAIHEKSRSQSLEAQIDAIRASLEAPLPEFGAIRASLEGKIGVMSADIDAMRLQHQAETENTETALLEVCKSLTMQQQQLKHQEACTSMIHQLLQEALPGGVGPASETDALNVGNYAPLGKAAIEHLSARVDQLYARAEAVETSVSILQRHFTRLHTELEKICKQACENQAKSLREDVASLRGRQLDLQHVVDNLQEEQKACLSRQTTSDECRWKQRADLPEAHADNVASSEVVHGVSTKRDPLCAESGFGEDQQAQEVAAQLNLFRSEMRREIVELTSSVQHDANSEMHLKHKELAYMVSAQQNLLSQYAVELDTLRHEQQAGLRGVASFVQQELDTVYELSRILHEKASTVFAMQNPDSSQSFGPNVSEMVRLLRHELESVSGGLQKELDNASQLQKATPSGWPMLQKKLSDMTEQVNDIGYCDESSHRGVLPSAANDSHVVHACSEDARFGGTGGTVQQHTNFLDTFLELAGHTGGEEQVKNSLASKLALPGSPSRSLRLGQADAHGSATCTSSWKHIQEEIRNAAETLQDDCVASPSVEVSAPTRAVIAQLEEAAAQIGESGVRAKLESVLRTLQHPDMARA